MKKTLFLSAAAAVLALAGTSCSSENDQPMPGNGNNVSFRVSIPEELQSRAFGDGLQALELSYAVYASDDANHEVLRSGSATFQNLHTTVNFSLPKGKKYDIIFWAQADGAPFAFDMPSQTMTVTYAGMDAYSEKFDAFTWTEKEFMIDGTVSEKEITLYRPFAQVNIGALNEDIANADEMKFDYSQSKVYISDVYTQLNLKTGECVPSSLTNVQFDQMAIPTGERFPFPALDQPATITYLSMNYVLVPAEKTANHEVRIDLAESYYPETKVLNVPMQRNYRTNIYGTLISSEVSLKINIEPDFYEPDNNVTF